MAGHSKKILKNTTALAITRVSNLIASFVLGYVLARTLSVAGMGIYSTVISYYTVTEIICSVGMRSFLTRDIARDLSQTSRYLLHAAILTTFASLAANLLSFLIVPQLGYTAETTLGITIANLALFPATWSTIYESIFIAHQKAEFLSYTMLFVLLSRVSISVYLLLNGHRVVSLLILQVILQYIAFAIQSWFLLRHITVPQWEFDFSFLKAMLKELRTFTAIGFLASMFSQIEILLLSTLKGESAVGIYSAASKLTLMWFVIPESYMRAVFPVLAQMYSQQPQAYRKLLERSAKYLLAFALPLAVGTAITADKIILLFYGSDFGASVRVLQWLSLIFISIFLNEILWRVLLIRNEQHLALRTQIVGVLIKGGVSLLAVPFLGYMGTVIAMLATQVVYTSLHLYYVQRGHSPIPLLSLIWRFALAAALMGGVTWLLAQHVHLFIVVLVAVVIYGTLVFLLKAFSPEDLAIFNALLQRRRPSSKQPSS